MEGENFLTAHIWTSRLCDQFSHCFPAGLSDKQLLQPSVDALELGSDRELQRSLSG